MKVAHACAAQVSNTVSTAVAAAQSSRSGGNVAPLDRTDLASKSQWIPSIQLTVGRVGGQGLCRLRNSPRIQNCISMRLHPSLESSSKSPTLHGSPIERLHKRNEFIAFGSSRFVRIILAPVLDISRCLDV
jgi:hypothetical protein